MPTEPNAWHNATDPSDGSRVLVVRVGPYLLEVAVGARGSAGWRVRGPALDGTIFDTGGMAPTVDEARRRALSEARTRLERVGDAIPELLLGLETSIDPEWELRPGPEVDIATADVGPFRLYAFPDHFAIRGPDVRTHGETRSLRLAKRAAIHVLRKYLKSYMEEEVEGHPVEELLADLDALARATRRVRT